MKSDRTFFSAFCPLYHFNVRTYIHVSLRFSSSSSSIYVHARVAHVCTYISNKGQISQVWIQKKHTLCSSPLCDGGSRVLGIYCLSQRISHTPNPVAVLCKILLVRYLNRVFHFRWKAGSVSNFLEKIPREFAATSKNLARLYTRDYMILQGYIYAHKTSTRMKISKGERLGTVEFWSKLAPSHAN